jgi:cytochrome c oxidase subunit 2
LTPHSPGTGQIDTLLWIGFIAAAILVIAINLGLFGALRRFRSERGSEPRQVRSGRGVQFRVGATLTLFAAAVFILGVIFTSKAHDTPTTGPAGLASAKSETLTIHATGQQWLWRYDYPNGAFSYYKLVVPVDTAIDLRLESTDVIHTWSVPDLAAKTDAVPGKVSNIVFRADEVGHYMGASSTFSGQGYAAMRTEVEVVSPAEYEEFIKVEKKEVNKAQERVVKLIQEEEVP